MNSAAVCSRVARHLSGRPLFMEPSALKAMLDSMGPRLGLLSAESEAADTATLTAQKRATTFQRLASIVDAEPIDVANGMAEYGLTAGGVAVIPIMGTLVDRFDWLSALCGFVTYDSLKLTMDTALGDARVKAILLDIDSPGGEAAGMLDCADRIRAVNAIKPVWACANPLAASAAYALASAAGRITLPRLAAVGSIGVVAVHVDQSAADQEAGLKFTALYAGAQKIDGWGHAPLAEDAQKRFQAKLDAGRRKFAASVAGNRRLALDAVLATEAGIYDDDAAVQAKLADAVMPFEETLAELTAKVGGVSQPGYSGAAQPHAQGRSAVHANSDLATIVELCVEAGSPERAAGFIKRGVSIDEVKAQLDTAATIRGLVMEARKISAELPAGFGEELIAVGASVATARTAIFDQLVAKQSPEIFPHTTAMTGLDPSAGNYGWDRAIRAVNERNRNAGRL